MHTAFPSGPDTIRISVSPVENLPGQFALILTRNHVQEVNFTRDELHRVLDNARDILLVVADGRGSNYKGEFGGAK